MTRHLDERPDDKPLHRRDARQPCQASATEQPQEHRLRLIVSGMADGDAISSMPRRRCPQKGVPHLPSSVLGGQPMLSLVGGDITALAHAEETKLIRGAVHKAG